MSLTEADKKRLRLQGLDKRARGPFFNGHRIDKGSNFTKHVCVRCGEWYPCWMRRCTHACVVHVMACCEPRIMETWTKEERERWNEAQNVSRAT